MQCRVPRKMSTVRTVKVTMGADISNATYAWVKINGTEYSSSSKQQTVTVDKGAVAEIYVKASSGTAGALLKVSLNGEVVAQGSSGNTSLTYYFDIIQNCKIYFTSEATSSGSYRAYQAEITMPYTG